MDTGKKTARLLKKGKKGIFTLLFSRTGIIIFLLLLQMAGIGSFLIYLRRYFFVYWGASTAIVAAVLIYLLNTGGNPSVKLTWAVLIALVPAFGILLYLFVRLDLGHRLERRVIGQAADESAVYIPDQSSVMEQLRREEPGLYHLAAYTCKFGGYPAYQNTSVRYFPTGEEAFDEMLLQLEQAERFIFLEYFIIEEGYMWGHILDVLRRKARQGVEVRVMYDGTCSISSLPQNYPRELEKLGIRSKTFSPLRPLVSTYYNNRDHRKILVIDGRTAFTGGINLADEYINWVERFGYWKDNALMMQGDAVQSFTRMFLQMWNATEQKREYATYLLPPAPAQKGIGYVLPYGDSPLEDENAGEMVYLDVLNRANDYVYIMTPYLILDNEMLTALTFAAKRGVDVRILLPHVPDKNYTFVLAKSHYKELLTAGVRIFEYTPGFLHSKVFVSDHRTAVVGTVNLDYRSLYLHFECAAYLYDVPAVQDVYDDFVQTQRVSQEISMEMVREEKFSVRAAGALLKIVAPLL